MTATVRNNPSDRRYEICVDDELAGFTTYELTDDRIAFHHTETFPAFAGRGLAKQLVTEALDDVARGNSAVLPFCPYVRKFISLHSATYLHLVPVPERERFGLT